MKLSRVEEAAEQMAVTLSRAPSGLFTDIDGTISHVAATPDEASVVSQARDALERISTRITIVGAITGRAAESAYGMLALDGAIVIGNHGYERFHQGERTIHPSAVSSRAEIASAVESITAIVKSAPMLEGVLIENKDLSASVHYRLAVDHDRVGELLLRLVTAITDLHDLTVTEGKLVFEIRPRATVNKGTAIRDIAAELGLQGVVYLGDDVTDVDAFRALTSMQSAGISALSIGIVSDETRESVREAANLLVNGVDDCVELLQEVAARL